jgi:hypothetical protein
VCVRKAEAQAYPVLPTALINFLEQRRGILQHVRSEHPEKGATGGDEYPHELGELLVIVIDNGEYSNAKHTAVVRGSPTHLNSEPSKQKSSTSIPLGAGHSSPTSKQINSRMVRGVWRNELDMKDVCCDRAVVQRTLKEAVESMVTKGSAQQVRLDVAGEGSSAVELERLVKFIEELQYVRPSHY